MSHVVARIKVEDPVKWLERARSVGSVLRESHGMDFELNKMRFHPEDL